MPSYEVVNAKDARMPSSAGNGTPLTLLASHDTEGGTGAAGAEGTISWMIQTAAKRNASYHEIISYDESARRFRVYETVDGTRAAHSIAPQPISPTSGLPLYIPDAHVRKYLGVNIWNPNQGVYAQSIAGKIADVARYSEDRFFLECMHRRALEIRAKHPTLKARAEHFRFNPRTRTDWGRVLMNRLGGLVIPEKLDLEDGITMRLRRKAEPWTFPAGTKVYAYPDTSAPVLAILEGGAGVTDFEEAFYDENDELLGTGRWRGLLLTPDTDKIGWVQRVVAMKPVPAPGFNELVRAVLWETDIDAIPTFPLPDTSELKRRLASKNEAFAAIVEIANVGKET